MVAAISRTLANTAGTAMLPDGPIPDSCHAMRWSMTWVMSRRRGGCTAALATASPNRPHDIHAPYMSIAHVG